MAPAHRIERWLFWGCALLAAHLHWLPPFPPQIDLSQHAAQIRLLHDWLVLPTFEHQELFELNLLTPYLIAYVAGAMLSLFVSAVTAVKILWTLGVLGTVATAVRLRRQLGGVAHWDWLLIPGIFGITSVWGLLTFQCAIPFGLLALGQWYRLLDNPTLKRSAAMAGTMAALFFCHMLVLVWTAAACGAMLLLKFWQERFAKSVILPALALAAPVPITIVWFLRTRGLSQATRPTEWELGPARLEAFFAQWASLPDSVAGFGMGAIILLAPFVIGARERLQAVHFAPLVVTLTILLFGPSYAFGNAFTYQRFFSLLGPSLVVALVGVRLRAPNVTPGRALLPIAMAGMVIGVGRGLVGFAAEQRSFTRIMSHMPPGARVLSLVYNSRSDVLGGAPVYMHFPVWYQAAHGGLVEFSFASFYPTIVRFRDLSTRPVSERFSGAPPRDLPAGLAGNFDFILIRDHDTPGHRADPRGSELLVHDDNWWLYRTTTSSSGV